MTWWNYVGWGCVPTSSESAVVVLCIAEQRGVDVEAKGGIVVDVCEGVGVPGGGSDRREAAAAGDRYVQDQDVPVPEEGIVLDDVISDLPVLLPPLTTLT